MKKNVFLAVTLLAFIAVGAFAQQYDSESDFQVSKVGNGMRIDKYVGKKTVVNIPPTIQNTTVTHIGENAFATANITSVTIPNGVTFIGNKAFNPCNNALVSVTLNCKIMQGNFMLDAFSGYINIKFYDKNAYDGTQGTYTRPNGTSTEWRLTQAATPTPAASQYDPESDFQVTIPRTDIRIDKYVGSKTVVNIPPTIQTRPVRIIGVNAFMNNSKLTSVTIPNSVENIEQGAFYGTGITSIILPSVTSIGKYAFQNCTNLTSVTIQGTISSNEFSADAFLGLGDLRDKYLKGGAGTYTRPNGSSTTWTKK